MSGPISTILPDIGLVTIPAASGLTSEDALPWLIDVDVFEQAVSHVNWDTTTISTTELLNGFKVSSGMQNDEINFDVVLAKGTWDIEFLVTRNSSSGIIAVQLGGNSVGTVDLYTAASPTRNARMSLSGISVTASAKYRLRLLMATKNASSGGYYCYLIHVQLRRTA